MTEQEIYQQLSKQSPTGYKLNELIPFSYPVRRIKLELLVNKQPDGSLVKVYNVLLRAIKAGFQTQEKLFEFLGLGATDEFILRELFSLREKDYINIISEKWILTEGGEQFLNDNSILRVEEEEEYDFLLDGISGEVISLQENKTERNKLTKYLPSQLKLAIKSPDLLENKFQALADVYKKENESKSYLISYSADEIKKDYEEWCDYYLVEYIPDRKSNQESRLEVRNFQTLRDNKELTSKFNSDYRHFIYALSNSDRNEFEALREAIEKPIKHEIQEAEFSTLTIWETKQKFIDALKSVNEKILIESPWIKRATQEYIPLFQEILKAKKQLVILYGISEKDEHDIQTLDRVKELQQQYKENFKLIHLPTHFRTIKVNLTGTHRKLVIKDKDFYIAGSFNFLSFGKNENQHVANEESLLISKDVENKWEQVFKEYSIKFLEK
jgi:hypothetical protein